MSEEEEEKAQVQQGGSGGWYVFYGMHKSQFTKKKNHH